MEQSETKENNSKSAPFLVFTFGVGFLIIACLVYLGTYGFNFWLSILIGGVAQVFFRVIKRIWANAINDSVYSSNNSNSLVQGGIDTLPTFKIFALLYVAMVSVSALWYGIGAFLAWLF
ncbi:hypothetical protein EYS14_01305 [Alteromonadaceae bacterium M269]|nr:hypothetical protein EYS14_01305 [Alteromonadaceae bacterium M269]